MYTYKPKAALIAIKVWAKKGSIEPDTLQQIENLASLPFAYHHAALMPDGHTGYGMPIGGVVATVDHVIPNAVGVDIGCGMLAVKTSLTSIQKETLKHLLGYIRQTIPVGFKHNKKRQNDNLMPKKDSGFHYPNVSREYESALYQLGTLGGGNHFIEIQKGSDNHIWFMIHSGSRNIGYKVAGHYNNLAKKLSNKFKHKIPPSWDVAYLPVNTDEAISYLKEMQFCLEFALANRKLMAEKIKYIFKDITHCSFEDEINIHHNYANLETHFGKKVYVHRKGATSAKNGELGIIPGSQGSPSYIVRGLGNAESFTSCAHGAGRKMSRHKARKCLDLEKEKQRLAEKGILHSIRTQRDLDEATSAYKDIEDVMREQTDLVEIVVRLEPLAVIKG
ncbi:RtcB family protein [Candidatus Margulisiibacteriota bacterium]